MTTLIEIPNLARTVFRDQLWRNENLQNAIAAGNGKLAAYQDIMTEVFGGLLYLPQSSKMIEDDKVTPDIKWGKEFIDQVVNDDKYPALIKKTTGSTFHSAVALNRIAEELKKTLPKDKTVEPEEIRDRVRDLHKEMQQLQDLMKACKEQGMDTTDEQQKIAALQEIKKGLVANGKKAVENAAENAAKAIAQMSRTLGKAIDQADKDVDEAEEFALALGWGDDEVPGGESKTAEELLAIYLTLKNNPHLKKIIKEAGRFKKIIGAVKQKSIVSGETTHSTHEYGKDIRRVVSKDLMLLASPATKPLFMDKLVKQNLMLKKFTSKAKSGKGDIFLFRDCSGSTTGDINDYLAAATWAIAQTANKEGRAVEIVNFASNICYELIKENCPYEERRSEANKKYQTYSFPGRKMPEDELLKAIGFVGGGGTSWENALNHGVGFIEKQQGTLTAKVAKMKSKFDFILLTDGSCDVDEEWLKRFLDFKKKYGVTCYGILVQRNPNEYKTKVILDKLGKFCDQVLDISNLEDDKQAADLLTIAL